MFHSFQLCFIFHSVCKKTLHFLLHISRIRDFFVNSVSYFHAFVWHFLIFKFDISICVSYFYGATGTFDKVSSNLTFGNRGGSQLTSRSSNRFYSIQIQLNLLPECKCQLSTLSTEFTQLPEYICQLYFSMFIFWISLSFPIAFIICNFFNRIFQSLSIVFHTGYQFKSDWSCCQNVNKLVNWWHFTWIPAIPGAILLRVRMSGLWTADSNLFFWNIFFEILVIHFTLGISILSNSPLCASIEYC